jgi:hypothetical protein
MRGDVAMHEAAAVVFDDHEHVKEPERHGDR